MYLYKGELVAGMIIFGIAWALIPWNPLTAAETAMAAISVLAVSFGTVAVAEQAAEKIIRELKKEPEI